MTLAAPGNLITGRTVATRRYPCLIPGKLDSWALLQIVIDGSFVATSRENWSTSN